MQRAIGNRAVNDLIAHRAPPTLQRAPGWRDVDAQADDRRLAHARDGYLFDKSLKGPDEGVTPGDRRRSAEAHEATTARLAGQGVDARSNDVPWPPATAFFFWKYREDPGAAVAHYVKANKLAGTKQQVATIHARAKAKANIPPPESVLAPEAVAAHLGKFANGAHAFIDPSASKKIEGEITDPRFKGWGVDANFVAPLDEANALNAKAHAGAGIETIEEELGIPGKYWSKTEWNPRKQLVRWIIPKPKLAIDAGDDEVSLEMAKGTEWGADSALWVAGGLTKGGASEAVLKAIPRPQLIKMLAKGTIRQVTETYPETRDGIT
ncbi:MAG TPA: hypothetical protein VFP61_11900 [Acidimicrobiales bacterium]|nr:hypothetical protein [Acidimicrobiales bacterium]